MGKHTIQCFRHATYYTCVLNMVCGGACKCGRMPLLFRPGTYQQSDCWFPHFINYILGLLLEGNIFICLDHTHKNENDNISAKYTALLLRFESLSSLEITKVHTHKFGKTILLFMQGLHKFMLGWKTNDLQHNIISFLL